MYSRKAYVRHLPQTCSSLLPIFALYFRTCLGSFFGTHYHGLNINELLISEYHVSSFVWDLDPALLLCLGLLCLQSWRSCRLPWKQVTSGLEPWQGAVCIPPRSCALCWTPRSLSPWPTLFLAGFMKEPVWSEKMKLSLLILASGVGITLGRFHRGATSALCPHCSERRALILKGKFYHLPCTRILHCWPISSSFIYLRDHNWVHVRVVWLKPASEASPSIVWHLCWDFLRMPKRMCSWSSWILGVSFQLSRETELLLSSRPFPWWLAETSILRG